MRSLLRPPLRPPVGPVLRNPLTLRKGVGVAPYLGQVATRSVVPAGLIGALTNVMSRSHHKSRQAITSLQIVVPNFYINDPSGLAETAPGAATTVTASIEYPAGTFTQVKFSTIAAGTVPNGGMLLSDVVAVAIPDNTDFWVRMYLVNANGVVLDGSGFQGSVALGDMMNSFEGDKTMTGTVFNQYAGFMVAPLAIVAQTIKPSVYGLGTSRMAGINDVHDSSGDLGILMRSVGPSLAYINGGRASDNLAKFVASHTNRIVLAGYCSHVVVEMANDDIAGGLATTKANLDTILGYFPNHKKMLMKADPRTTGAWTLANQTDQTVATNFNAAWNPYLDTVPGIERVYSPPSVTSTGVLNKWNADGTAAKWTSDGVHESQYANLQIQAAGIIQPSHFTR